MPAKCLAHPYLLTFQLDLRPASSLWIYQETTALLFLLPVRMKVFHARCFVTLGSHLLETCDTASPAATWCDIQIVVNHIL